MGRAAPFARGGTLDHAPALALVIDLIRGTAGGSDGGRVRVRLRLQVRVRVRIEVRDRVIEFDALAPRLVAHGAP